MRPGTGAQNYLNNNLSDAYDLYDTDIAVQAADYADRNALIF
ncbi:MAG: hypothetical protein WCJ01_02525 [Ignavibacteria bacterium]